MKKLLIKILARLLSVAEVWIYKLKIHWNGNLWNYRSAVKHALRCAKTGGRYYVFFLDGEYRVFNRKDIQRLKNAGVFKRTMNTQTMQKICLFDTLDGISRHPNQKYNVGAYGIRPKPNLCVRPKNEKV